MADSRIKQDDKEADFQILALRAAVSDKQDAIQAWLQLTSQMDFGQFSPEISRIVPGISKNLRGNLELKDFLRLRGVAKRTWSQNQRALNSLSKAAKALQEIDYRVIKGAAILLYVGDLGSRSMGDIDLLISRTNLSRATEALRQVGFTEEFANFCPHREGLTIEPEVLFIDQDGVQIDLHIAERHSPVRLHQAMLANLEQTIAFRGKLLKVPSPELTLLHALSHGLDNTSPGDYLQSIIDLAALESSTDLELLDKQIHLAKDSNSTRELLRAWQSRDLALLIVANAGNKSIRKPRMLLVDLLPMLNKLLANYKSRKIPTSALWQASKSLGVRRPIYFFWLKLGKPRLLEELIARSGLGLLPFYKQMTTLDCSLAQEMRFHWATDDRKTDSMTFEGMPLVHTSFLLFRDGRLLGSIGGKGELRSTVRIPDAAKMSEYSLRLSKACCAQCASKFGKIEIVKH